nr:iron-containing alcohol dehydrogenase [Maliibacterium massiliense]
MNFQYCIPTRIVFGAGSIDQMNDLLPEGNVLMVVDPIMTKLGTAQQLAAKLTGRRVEIFDEVEPNPPFALADRAASIARGIEAAAVVGVGGGSSLDVAKAAAMLRTNQGSAVDYIRGGKKLRHHRAFLMLLPTTAGTGSEVTNTGVFTDLENHTKCPWVDQDFIPDIALVDPALTYSLPAKPTASTGLDALCQALESYWSQARNPITQSYALPAIRMVMENLREAVHNPQNADARAKMSAASLLAGLAMSQTRTTVCHGVSFGLTGQFNIPHGIACVVTLSAALRRNYAAVKEDIDLLLPYIGYKTMEEFADAIDALMLDVDVPTKLSAYGVTRESLPSLAEGGANALVSKNNPIVFTAAEIQQMLEEIF